MCDSLTGRTCREAVSSNIQKEYWWVFKRVLKTNIITKTWLPVDSLTETPIVFPWEYVLIFVGLSFVQGGGTGTMGLFNNLRSFLWIGVQQYTEREIQVDLFRHLHSLSLRWHLQRKTGEVLRVMDRGTDSINNLLSYIIFQITPTIIDILVACVFFVYAFNWWFGLIVFLTMFLYIRKWSSKTPESSVNFVLF